MTCSIIVSNKDTYFYSFMSKRGAISVTAFREMALHMLHVGRMRSVSYEANLVVFFVGPFSLSHSSAPSPFLCEEP